MSSGGGKGGKGGGGGSVAKDYYASFAGIAGWGPADYLVSLLVDGKEVWRPETPVARSDSANPYQFDVAGYGRVFFYWGTENQELVDPVLPSRDHPPYRRRVLVVFSNFLCGRERTSVPDIRVIFQRAPQQTLITGDAAALDAAGQANPLAALAELITNPVTGLGRSTEIFDTDGWQALAEELEADAENTYLSIELTSTDTMRALFGQVNGYLDTWFRIDDAGRIAVGRFATGIEPPAELPELTEHDMAAGYLPRIRRHGYGEADNRMDLVFIDRNRAYADNAVRYDSPFNREIVSAENTTELQRPWIRRQDQALTIVARIGGRESQPYDELSHRVRPERSADLAPGDLYWCIYSQMGYARICRIVRRTGDGDHNGPVIIEAESERGFVTAPWAPGGQSIPSVADPDPEDLTYWHPLQATPEMADGQLYRVIVLAGQQQGAVRGFDFYYRDASEEFATLGWQGSWAVPVKFAAAYADDTAQNDTSGDLQVEQYTDPEPRGFDNIESPQSADAIAADSLLLIAITSTGEYEVMTVQSLESPTAGVYPVHVVRGRLGTEPLAFAADDRAYIIRRQSLVLYTSPGLTTIGQAAGTAKIKLTPFTANATLPLADATEKNLPMAVQDIIIEIDGNADL